MARSLRNEVEVCHPDDVAAEDVDHEGDVDPARVGLHVGEVRHPEPVGSVGHELAIDQVGRPVEGVVTDGGPLPLPPSACSLESQVTHEALDGAAGHPMALPVQLGPDLVGSVDVEVLRPDPLDLDLQLLVPDPAGAQGPVAGGVVGGGSELQSGADRLDSPSTLPSIDVANYLFGRPSSSVAKKIEASFNISLARRSSLTSRSSSLIFSCSSVVSPGRSPSSISVRRTQIRSVSGVIPSFADDRRSWPPIPRGTRPCARRASGRPAHGPPGSIGCSLALLHPLKGRSLQDSRADSLRSRLVTVSAT